MCGIAGLVGRSLGAADVERRLERMLPGIASRGPDGVGRLVEPGVGLLHTRLAIIDLVTGDQPIWNETGDVGCVFNGEIYNYRSLADELRARGHTLKTQSDTEVLVHLYEDHGAELVHRIRGMYAFAIFDRRRRALLLARDRRGIKPLYLADVPDGMAFASSIESLLAAGASRDVDSEALAQYLRFYRVPEPRTAYRSVRALPPGHTVLIDIERGERQTRRFYSLPAARPTRDDDGRVALSEARAALIRAVGTHLVADVEVAAFLSGGIDSSLVVAEAQRVSPRPLRTFCIRFEGAEYDESAFAERVARHVGTRHETIAVSAAPAELLREGLHAAQQPFGVASFLPLLLMCKQAARDVKVVLTGDGGDEVAFGYAWYRWMRATQGIPRLGWGSSVANRVRTGERLAGRSGFHRVRRALKFARGVLAASHPAAADAWRYELVDGEALELLRPEFRPPAVPASPNEEVWSTEENAVSALRRADLEVTLRDEMLPKLDRAGMAVGLEGRVPLLDDDFVEAMTRVPARLHLADSKGKAVLREWAREVVPGLDLERPKHGFDVPMRSWLLDQLRDDVRRLLLDPSRRGLVTREGASRVWGRVLAGVPGAAHTAYAILVAELWLEESAARATNPGATPARSRIPETDSSPNGSAAAQIPPPPPASR
jgi:asparagine synthase (glutamine-hydrolysing)